MGLVDKYILFTNLDMVIVGGVRTHCSALLLERTEDFLNRGQHQCKARGFGPDPAWPVFDLFLKTPDIEYVLQSAQSESVSMMVGNEPRPMFTGALLQIKDGPQLQLIAAINEQPIQVDVFEGPSEERIIRKVWDVLSRRVVEFSDTPNRPVLGWVRK